MIEETELDVIAFNTMVLATKRENILNIINKLNGKKEW